MNVSILIGDCRERLRKLPDASVHCCVTSPPYFGLRDYGHAGQIGLEPTPDEYVAGMVEVFREVRRVLRDDGTLWLNIGDSYSGSGPSGASYQSKTTLKRAGKARDGNFSISQRLEPRGLTYAEKKPVPAAGTKAKDLIGIPWMLAFALRADGWYLRQEIIWSKPNPMPESVRDRCTKAHEQIFLLSKSPRYYFDQEPIREPVKETSGLNMRAPKHDGGRGDKVVAAYADVTTRSYEEIKGANRRSVWSVPTQPYSEAHFATYPPALIEPCILAGCPDRCCAKCGLAYNMLLTAGFACGCNAGTVPGTVLDPFGGAGTTGLVADRLGRNAILIELNPEYAEIAERRLNADGGMFAEVKAA